MRQVARFQIYRVLLWMLAAPPLCLCTLASCLGLTTSVDNQITWMFSTIEFWAIVFGFIVTAEAVILFPRLDTVLNDLRFERQQTAMLIGGTLPADLLRNAVVGGDCLPAVPSDSSPKTSQATAVVLTDGLPVCIQSGDDFVMSGTVSSLKKGASIVIYGRDELGTWVAISPNGGHWVAVEGLRISEDVLGIPIIGLPPHT